MHGTPVYLIYTRRTLLRVYPVRTSPAPDWDRKERGPSHVLGSRRSAVASLHDQRHLLHIPEGDRKEGGPISRPRRPASCHRLAPNKQALYMWRVWEQLQPSPHQGRGPTGPFLQRPIQLHYDTSRVIGVASQPPYLSSWISKRPSRHQGKKRSKASVHQTSSYVLSPNACCISRILSCLQYCEPYGDPFHGTTNNNPFMI